MKKIKKQIYAILLIILIITVVLIPIIINKSKNANIEKIFVENVKDNTIEKYKYCDNIDITGEFNSIVCVNMNKEFSELDYVELEKIVIDITTNIEYIFDEYVNDMKKIDNKYSETITCDISINSESDSYKYNNKTNELRKNDKVYNLIISLKEFLKNKIQDDSYTKYIDDITDESNLNYLSEIEDINECKSEIIYQYAQKQYALDNSNEFNNAFELIKDYKNINELHNELENKHKFDGEWYGKMENASDSWNFGDALNYATHKWIFYGDKCYLIYSTQNEKNKYDIFYSKIENNTIYIYKNYDEIENRDKAIIVMNYINNELQYKHKLYTTSLMSIHKTSDNTELPKSNKIKEPTIGMDKKEIENSTWGEPTKKNIDTYSWGTEEQWVYENKGYIYFKNGIVSSISER